jgi:hypothetical protein
MEDNGLEPMTFWLPERFSLFLPRNYRIGKIRDTLENKGLPPPTLLFHSNAFIAIRKRDYRYFG